MTISNFNPFLLCVQHFIDCSYSNSSACKEDKGSYRADGPKDIKFHSTAHKPQEGWYSNHLYISSEISKYLHIRGRRFYTHNQAATKVTASITSSLVLHLKEAFRHAQSPHKSMMNLAIKGGNKGVQQGPTPSYSVDAAG